MTITEPASYGLSCRTMPAPFMDQAHQHGDLELNYADVALTYLIGGDRLTLPPHRIVLFWAARPHQLVPTPGAGHASADRRTGLPMTWVTIPLERALTWSLPDDGVQQLLGGSVLVASAEVSDLYRHRHLEQWSADLASSALRRHDTVALELQALVTRVLTDADRRIAGRAEAWGPRLARVADMAHFIARHSHEDLRVATIAEVAHVHPHHAMAIFKEVAGCSISTYLTQTRVALAQRLLLTTDLAVVDVGHQAGFGSQSRFYAAFSAHSGMPPADFRRRHRLAGAPTQG